MKDRGKTFHFDVLKMLNWSILRPKKYFFLNTVTLRNIKIIFFVQTNSIILNLITLTKT